MPQRVTPKAPPPRFTQLPDGTDALLDLLDKLVPERSPSLEDSEREVWAKAGERRLVATLRAARTAQLNRPLK